MQHNFQSSGNRPSFRGPSPNDRAPIDYHDRAAVKLEDIDLFVPHQANMRIISAVAERLGLPPEKVFTNIERYGNTSAASVPIALDEALEQGRIHDGNIVMLNACGGGLTWGANLIRW